MKALQNLLMRINVAGGVRLGLVFDNAEKIPDDLRAEVASAKAEVIAALAHDLTCGTVTAGPSYEHLCRAAYCEVGPSLSTPMERDVHIVRYAPPVIELRLEQSAPHDLTQNMAEFLSRYTGTRWSIALSDMPGAPTVAEVQSQAAMFAAVFSETKGGKPLMEAALRLLGWHRNPAG